MVGIGCRPATPCGMLQLPLFNWVYVASCALGVASLLVGGKARHAQGQRLDRYEVRRKEKVRERKGRGKSPPSFLCF